MSTLAKLKLSTMGRTTQSRIMMDDSVPKIYDSVLDIVGNTPLIKLAKIPSEYNVKCDIFAKCEFMNPSGSNKDRIGKSMTQDAKDNGKLHSYSTIVEASSGNTGIAVALNATLFENGCIIVTKEKNSNEKLSTMRLLGADVIQIKNSENEEETAKQVIATDPKKMMTLGQFENPVNPDTHYKTTGLEIISAMENKIDVLVMGAGTGGTLTGVGKRIKQECVGCKVIAAEPDGSTMLNTNSEPHSFLIEGIGGNEVPKTFDTSVVDCFEVVTDEDAFLMARELALKEGLLCGGSSGAIMVAAIKAAQDLNLKPHNRIVVILPDGIRNYMDKFVSDQWMEALLFKDPPLHTMKWWNQPITNLNLKMKYPVIDDKKTCAEALDKMKNLDIAVVVDCKEFYVGAVSKDAFRNYATNPKKFPKTPSEDMDFNTPVTDHLVKNSFTLANNGKKGIPTIGRLSRILDITPFVVIGKDCTDGRHFIPETVVTADDVLDYIFTGSKKGLF